MAPSKKVSASVVREEIELCRKRWGWTPSDIINMLRGGGSSGKGSNYEREICKELSLWWTEGGREDIFWRSSGSGARAKVRGRAGRATAGQHGDIAATDPIGGPFIDAFTVELKRGYSEHTIQDVFDRMDQAGVQEWENFFAQTMESQQQAGSLSWLLFTRRDRRKAMVWTPQSTVNALRHAGAFSIGRPRPFIILHATVRLNGVEQYLDVCGMQLEHFLTGVSPVDVKRYLEISHGDK